ncbi:putative ROK family transcriptional regulator [Actinacidiphila reveromycinica]|uniref:Putative ROK family transcriptional regulator n=1 Tax=Actinacidiphila reveromycinica TaxID=659352 RepID=A0A7U3UN58_9ACTN|nr:ROK family transcriptional regulator [Streptomyces sp. SN-593]BBA95590.1 putative ROK family transcriptional regulator [Streptomyces sp. SN-593]
MDVSAPAPWSAVRMSTADIREANVAAVCRTLRGHGGLTRAQVGRLTGLTRPTVMAVVQQLVAQGLVVEEGQLKAASGGGRPGTLLHFRSRARVVSAVRLRNARVEVTLADMAGNVLAHSLAPTAPEPGDWTDLVASFAGRIAELRDAHPDLGPLAAVAMTLPGSIDRARGRWTVVRVEGWSDLPAADALADAVGVPVGMVNVVAATLIGRLAQEPAPAQSAALVYVGHGVGSAATVGGRLIDGATGSAGELGHCVLPGVEALCRCGRRGCVESVTSVLHLRREFERITGRPAPPTLAGMEDSGDPAVLAMLELAARRLALAASWQVNIVNPEVVYFGGNPFTDGCTRFFGWFAEELRASAYRPNSAGLSVLPLSSGATLRGAIQVASELLPPFLRPELRLVC